MKDQGFALVVCLLATALLLAVTSALVLTSSVEVLIAGNYRDAEENRLAAEAALELAINELSDHAAWTPVLNGTERSTFVDGAPGGSRSLSDGSTVNLTRLVNLASCGRTTTCTTAQVNASTLDRPWGVNNPRWQLFGYGRLTDMLPVGVASSVYVVVLVGDDQGENDGDPLVDGAEPGNPGHGVVVLRAESFGARGRHSGVEATVLQTPTGVRIRSWRAIAQLDPP